MANTKDTTGARIKREMDAVKNKLKKEGMKDMEIKQIMQDYFVQNKRKPAAKKVAAKVMTAAKGGMATKKKKK